MTKKIIKFVDSSVRRNIHIYVFFRSLARYVCKFMALEEGFDFLKYVSIKSQSVAVDVGSNDGTSVSMIRRFQKKSRILCFDPILKLNVSDNQVSFFYHGLSDKEKETSIYSPIVKGHLLLQYSSLSKDHMLENLMKDFRFGTDYVSFSESRIRLSRLDKLDINPFFLKIDVEGHELEVISGSKATIALHKPIILVEIQSSQQYRRIVSLLTELNYYNLLWPQVLSFKDWGAKMVFNPNQNNYIFLPNGKSTSWDFKRN